MKKVVIILITVLISFSSISANAALKSHNGQKQESTFPTFQPMVTVSQKNAIQKAKDYLSFSAFSKKGLIDQLMFEGFSRKDSTYAVNHINVNWNKQAAKKAKNYLRFSSFSRSGLIDQLLFEGFTQSQAVYGVNKTGL